MSRIGKKPIAIPEGVDIKIEPGCIHVKGPQGSMQQEFPSQIVVEVDAENRTVWIKRPNDEKASRALQGLARSLVANAINGVVANFAKNLTMVGVGYNAKLKGKHLELQAGYCLPRSLMIPDGIKVEVPAPTKIIVKGCDRHLVGQFAANIRKVRPPELYKGKGIRYDTEVIKLKDAKSTGK